MTNFNEIQRTDISQSADKSENVIPSGTALVTGSSFWKQLSVTMVRYRLVVLISLVISFI